MNTRRPIVVRLCAFLLLTFVSLQPAAMAAPGVYNPTCRQGETFSRTLTWKDRAGDPVPLAGYTAKLQIRDRVSRELVLELTHSSGLTLLGSNGRITWTMSPAQTAALSPGKYEYDLKLTSGTGFVTFLVAGYVNVTRAITQ